MADYHSPTVIRNTIPNVDMTPLEFLLLTNIFESEQHESGTYFYSEIGAEDFIWVKQSELREALDVSCDSDSQIRQTVESQLAPADPDEEEIELDMSGMSWEYILQDIVRRSSTLEYIEVVGAFTCSRMCFDGFGGMAIFVTAEQVKWCSTISFLSDCFAEFEAGKKKD